MKNCNSVFDVANYVLSKCGAMTTMKLQKLVYYCQAWSLAWDGKPLFQEDFEAWANGPVCPVLFATHRKTFEVSENFYKGRATSNFTHEEIDTMDAVIEGYAEQSAQWLSELTHKELPWKLARGAAAPGMPCKTIISKQDMQEYYAGLN